MNDRAFLAALPDEAAVTLVAHLIELECPELLGLKNHPDCGPNLSKITCRACWEQALKTETAPSDGAAPTRTQATGPR